MTNSNTTTMNKKVTCTCCGHDEFEIAYFHVFQIQPQPLTIGQTDSSHNSTNYAMQKMSNNFKMKTYKIFQYLPNTQRWMETGEENATSAQEAYENFSRRHQNVTLLETMFQITHTTPNNEWKHSYISAFTTEDARERFEKKFPNYNWKIISPIPRNIENRDLSNKAPF